MYALAIVAALVSAFLDASSAALQRRVTGQVEARELYRRNIMQQVIHHRLWIAGVGLQVLAFFAQAIALRYAPLVLVAPILTTDLVFLLLIIRVAFGVRIGARAWIAIVLLALGLAGLLVGTNPQGGNIPVSALNWTVLYAIIGGMVAISAVATRHMASLKWRAALGGLTAGLHFGLVGASTKLVVQQMQFGVAHLLTHWPLYALIVVGTTAFVSMQSMYGSGSLAISQPAVEITVTAEGILVGLFLFGDTVSTDTASLAMTVVGFVLLAVGVVMLSAIEQAPDVSLKRS